MPGEVVCWVEERSRLEDTTIQCPQAPEKRGHTVVLELMIMAEVKTWVSNSQVTRRKGW